MWQVRLRTAISVYCCTILRINTRLHIVGDAAVLIWNTFSLFSSFLCYFNKNQTTLKYSLKLDCIAVETMHNGSPQSNLVSSFLLNSLLVYNFLAYSFVSVIAAITFE